MDHHTSLLFWADEVLRADDGGETPRFPPLPQTVMRFDTAEEASPMIFSPAMFHPGSHGFRSVVQDVLVREIPGTDVEQTESFADYVLMEINKIEEYEHWVLDPLSEQEIVYLHAFFHEAMNRMLHDVAKTGEEDGLVGDVETWNDDAKKLADRLLLAIAYILAWQRYSMCVHFMLTMATPWVSRMGEVLKDALEDPSLLRLHSVLFCSRRRYNHFYLQMIHPFAENAGGGIDGIVDFEEDGELDNVADIFPVEDEE